MNYERENIRQMAGYQWGEQPDDPHTVKLNTNENPYPPGTRVQQVLRTLNAELLRVYPQPTADPLRDQLADLHGLARDNLIITHGGDEALRLAMTTFVDAGATFAMAEPSYSLYPVLAEVQGARLLRIPLDARWQMPGDFAAQLNRGGARLACVVNPHAPSGTLTGVEQLRAIAREFSGVLLVDEAYVDFVDPDRGYDLLPLVNELDNLLVLRTFSKGYSLAGLRLGYLAGAPGLIDPLLRKTRDSYNIDSISQALGCAAIQDRDEARAGWDRVRRDRRALADALQRLGFEVAASEANFLLARVPGDTGTTAAELYQRLKSAGILVRYFPTPVLADRLRITVGTVAQNQRLLAAIEDALYGRPRESPA